MLATACDHCGAPLVGDELGATRFCCAGCETAHGLIHRLGLSSYYRRRALDAGARPPRPDPERPSFDATAYVRASADGTCRLDLLVDGLHCAACVWLIEQVLGRLEDVVSARVNLTLKRLAIAWHGGPDRAAALIQTVSGLGYRVVPYEPAGADVAATKAESELVRAMAVAGFAAANVMLLSVAVWSGQAATIGPATVGLMHWVSALVALPAIAYAGRPFFRSAWSALRGGRTNMDVPIAVGVVLAAGMSLAETVRGGPHAYFDSTVTLLFFLLVGRALDARARGRARAAIGHVLGLKARSVRVLGADGTARVVAPEAVGPGAAVLVAAGERIPVDGRILGGRSAIDESLISGESAPRAVGPDDAVLAGTLNLGHPLTLSATATGEATVLADIARMVAAAEEGRSRYRALADRVARRYAPAVHGLAAATFLGWWSLVGAPWQDALLNAVTVLIITCPCALALAVPVVQVAAVARLARRGILVKSATALERLAAVDTVVLDKTGTLTCGRPVAILEATARPDLELAAGLAGSSTHPLARALARSAPSVPPLAGVREHPGSGLSLPTPAGEVRLGSRTFCGVPEGPGGEGPELWLARPGADPVRFGFVDPVREDASATVARLAADGCGVELLSGDRSAAVVGAAKDAGIAVWRAGVDPAGKIARLSALANQGRRTLMVGDGLNDAPALAAAHVSMSPAAAADISQTAADVVFQGDRLGAVPATLAMARRAAVLVRQNLAFALAYNAIAVPIAMVGLATPLIAAVAMSSSSIVVMANALRLPREAP
jgi:Cu2+-exporting ATPase